jgi:hypothetical protein
MIRTFLRYVPLKSSLYLILLSLWGYSAGAQCANVPLPVVQGFNSTTIPSCWFQQYLSGTNSLKFVASSSFPTTVPQEGTDYVNWNSYNYTSGSETRLVSPPITTTGTPRVDVNFYWYNENSLNYSSGQYLLEGVTVQYSFDSITWTTVQFYPRHDGTLASGTGQWASEMITLPAAVGNQATVYIGFKFHSGYGDNCSLDNVHITATPAPCLASPTGLSIGHVTTTSATAHWTDASPLPAIGYNWEVVLAGAGPTATPVVSGTVATGIDSVVLSGLSASQAYDFYIQSTCSSSNIAGWTGPTTFNTLCGSTTLPLIQGFNATTIPSCWFQQYASGTSDIQYVPSSTNPTTAPQEGTDFVLWNAYNYPAGTESRLVSPVINTTGVPRVDVNFYWYNENNNLYNSGTFLNEGMTVQYSYDSITWTATQFYPRHDSSLASGTRQWEQKILTLPAAAGNQAILYVGFDFYSAYGDNCSMDNLHIVATPACGALPTAISVGNFTGTSATAYWTDANPLPASGYNWVVVLSGAGSAGTPVASGTVATGVDSVTFSVLSSSTAYDFYIQSNCGSGQSAWAGPITFNTPCTTITLPLVQGFNSTAIPNCWSQQYVVGTTNLQYVASSFTPATTPQEGTDYVFWNSYSILPGNETRLVSPPINSTGVPSVDVSFYWYNENSVSYNSGTYLNEGMELQYSTNGTTWTDVQFYPRYDNSLPSGTGQWKQKYLTLPAAVGNQAIMYVGFKFHSSDGDNCSFDHLNIIPSPACAGGPTALNAYNITTNSANVNWTAASNIPSNGYNWRVVAAGDSINGVAIASGTSTTTADSAIITGLTANTPYDFYIQSNCGGNGLGVWEGPLTFSTICSAITSIPWTEGFEGLGTNVGTNILPPCWLGTPTGRWNSAHGTPFFPANIGPRTGTDYIFDRYNSKDTIFTPGFSLTAGVTYEFYYYYETDGNNGWDSIKTMCGPGQNAAGMTTMIGSVIYSPTNLSYVKFVAQFIPATSGTYYFGVNLNSNFSPYELAFDDFGLKVAPACPGLVSNEAVSNLTATSATLSWNAAAPAPANGYNWELVATGDSVNGTILFSGTTAAGITSVSLSGLSPYTSYDLYVQTNCGGILGAGDWTGPLTFRTPCSAITILPWHEGFEGLGSNTGQDLLPPCWLPTPLHRWTTSATPLTFAGITPRTGTNYLYDRYNANDTVFTPGFDLTAGTQYEFYFYYLTDGRTGWDSLYAMYGNSQSQSGMSVQIGPIVTGPTNTTYQKYSAIFTPATSGTYYFGVKLKASFTSNDIGFDDFGLQKVIPCPNPPVAGIISGHSTVCPGSTSAFTLTGYSPYTVLQWQSSSDSINFTDIVGANQDFLSVTISSVSYFRVKVKCADSTYTLVFTVDLNNPIHCYCSNVGGNCGSDNIDTVSILNTTFNVQNPPCLYSSSGAAYTQFADTGSATTTLQRGNTYTISVYLQNATISSAWIDFDQSGSFDSIEWVQTTNGTYTGTATITVPLNAVLGLTGFRVRTNYSFGNNGPTNACTNFFEGETFDFLIKIGDTICNITPTVSSVVTDLYCPNVNTGAIVLTVNGPTGPYKNRWTTGDTTATVSNLRGGLYTDSIGFHSGCVYLYNKTVGSPPALIGRIDSIDAIRCYGDPGAIFTTPTGGTQGSGYNSHWSTGETTSYITGKRAATYTDTVTDGRGCRTVQKDTIPGPTAPLAVSIDSTIGVKCNGQNNGAIYITVTGGTYPYYYNWSNATTARNLINVPQGYYTVHVADTNGCTTSVSDSVTQPNTLSVTTDSVVDTKCSTSSDGSIYIHVTGGKLAYQYMWTGGIPTYNLYLVSAGVYSVTITDANNCSITTTNTIGSPATITLTTTSTPETFGQSAGSATASAGGGAGGFHYRWNNGDTTASISNLTVGIYTVTATDRNGCTISQRDTVRLIVTSIKDINADVKNFNVYPNPSSGLFNVLVELTHDVAIQLEVYTVTGQQLSITTENGPLNNTYQLDLTDQPSGIYLVKLIAGDYSLVRRITLVK